MSERWAIVFSDGTLNVLSEKASFEEAARECLIADVFGEEARIARVKVDILSYAKISADAEPLTEPA